MAVWKKIAFQEDSSNFGSADQTQTDSERRFKIKTGGKLSFTSESPAPSGLANSHVPLRFEMSSDNGSTDSLPPASNVYMNSQTTINFETTICNFTASMAFLGITPLFSVQSDMAGSNDDVPGPELRLTRDVNGAANQKLGFIEFKGKNTSGVSHNYARIGAEITDATPNSEDGELHVNLVQDGDQNETAVIVESRPTQAQLEAGTSSSPVFYTDSIKLYGGLDKYSLRRRLINELGITTPFEVVFFPTTGNTIPPGTETWGITGGSPLFSASYTDRQHKGVRYASAQSTNIGDTFTRTVDNVGAMDISNSQKLDMGGASWIVLHHQEGVTPALDDCVRIYDFNMVFFFDPAYSNSSDNLDNDTKAKIRIYQADTDQSNGLDQPDPQSITWKLMGDFVIAPNTFADDGLTSKFFNINFQSDNDQGRGYDLFIVTIENQGTLDLFDADDGSPQSPGTSVPFIKGEITRRVCNKLEH